MCVFYVLWLTTKCKNKSVAYYFMHSSVEQFNVFNNIIIYITVSIRSSSYGYKPDIHNIIKTALLYFSYRIICKSAVFKLSKWRLFKFEKMVNYIIFIVKAHIFSTILF